MEEVITKEILASSKYVAEQTSFLELSAFSGSSCKNLVTEGPVAAENLEPWIRQEGEFAPQSRADVKNSGNLRMLFQETISHNSFQDGYITLPKSTWQDALEKNILSSRTFELASCPGLVLWTDMNFIPTNSTFEIVMQRASSKPTSAKWTLSLHHDMKSRETSGFYKATTNSDCQAVLKKLKSSSSQVGNPFLLPMLIFQEELGRIKDRQRDIRRQVRRIEDALGLRLGRQADTNPYTFNDGTVDFEFLNRELVECSAQLQKRTPMVYPEALKNLEEAMEVYGAAIPPTIDAAETINCHIAFMSRLRFQQRRIRVIETYHSVTSTRLTAQANALYNLIAQKDNKLNYLVAVESRRIAAASKYEGTAMRTISILGIVFLPGTFVASILSTSFFDFQTATVSHLFWIYWAITVPLTLAVLLAWILWYRTNKHNHLELDKQLELSMPNLAERRLSAK